jgi:hypothetical protein
MLAAWSAPNCQNLVAAIIRHLPLSEVRARGRPDTLEEYGRLAEERSALPRIPLEHIRF